MQSFLLCHLGYDFLKTCNPCKWMSIFCIWMFHLGLFYFENKQKVNSLYSVIWVSIHSCFLLKLQLKVTCLFLLHFVRLAVIRSRYLFYPVILSFIYPLLRQKFPRAYPSYSISEGNRTLIYRLEIYYSIHWVTET